MTMLLFCNLHKSLPLSNGSAAPGGECESLHHQPSEYVPFCLSGVKAPSLGESASYVFMLQAGVPVDRIDKRRVPKSQDNLTACFLVCGRKPGHPEETHTAI